MDITHYLLTYYQFVMMRIILSAACFISLTNTGRRLIRALKSNPDSNENE